MEYSKKQVKHNIVVENRPNTVFVQMYLRYSGDVKILLTEREASELYLKLGMANLERKDDVTND